MLPFSSLMMWVAAFLLVGAVFLCMRAVARRQPQPLRAIAWMLVAAALIGLVMHGSAENVPLLAAQLAVLFGALLTLILTRRRAWHRR